MNIPLKIGVGGLATTGKDTFAKLLKVALEARGISSIRMALADELKNEIQPKLIDKHGIDVWNCTPEQKEIIRPELVALGRERRLSSQGTYWTNIVQQKTNGIKEQVVIVPDIRYNFYPDDEAQWIRRINKGLLVHVSRYKIENSVKQWVQPPNQEERENDPLVHKDADFALSWNTLPYEELEASYGGFLDTVALIIENELLSARR